MEHKRMSEATRIISDNGEIIPMKGIQEVNGVDHSPMSTTDTAHLFSAEEDSHASSKSSIALASFNYINSIIGSGIIGIPYALVCAGPGLGIILLVVIAFVVDYSLIVMIRASNLIGVSTYQDLVYSTLGKPGFCYLTFMQFLYPVIAMISYNVIIGDNITKVFIRIFKVPQGSIISNRNFIVVLTTIFITLPLCLFRNISKLAKASFLSLFLVFVILLALLVRLSTMAGSVPPSINDWSFANSGVSESLSIMAFAFMCHHNSFLIYQSLENRSEERWAKTTHISLVASLIFLTLVGITGYATFRSFTQGDLLENYCIHDDLMNSARAVFAITIMLTYPIECFVTRSVLENSIFATSQPQPFSRHLTETLIVVFITMVASMATDCLGVVLEINGLVAAVPLAFILPFVCYLRVEEGHLLSRKKIPSIVIAACGFILMFSGIIWAIYKYSKFGAICSHGEEMFYCKNIPLATNTTSSFTTHSSPINVTEASLLLSRLTTG